MFDWLHGGVFDRSPFRRQKIIDVWGGRWGWDWCVEKQMGKKEN